MCEIGTILAIGSTVLGAAGAIQQGNAAAAAGRFNAQVSEMNATLSERRARDALDRGEREEQRKRQEVAALKGRQIAASGANGVDLSFGSPLDMIVDTAVLGELDALTIRKNTANEAYDHRVQAVNGRAEATLSRMNADNAQTAGYLGAAGTLLGGAGTAYTNFRRPSIGAFA